MLKQRLIAFFFALWLPAGANLLLTPELQQEWARQLSAGYPFRGYERVLDLGCGRGTVTAEMAQQVPDGLVLGIDSRSFLIAIAEQIYDPDLFANLQFQAHEVGDLDYQAQFDVVIASGGWHLNEQEQALAKVAAALRPGGKALLATPFPPAALGEAVAIVIHREEWATYFETFEPSIPTFSREEYASLVAQASLLPKRVRLHDYALQFATQEDLVAWLQGWLPHPLFVQAEQRETLLKEIAAELAEQELALTIVEVEAVKQS